MNELEKITMRLEQINSLMYVFEGAMLEAFDEVYGGINEINRVHNLFCILLEQLENLKSDIIGLQGHISVCDAIYALNHVDELKEEIEH